MNTRGSNAEGMRAFNERLVLQIVRQHPDGLPKAELARRTQLSAQAASTIVDRLLGDQLLRKLAPVRGRIGQPSVPIALNPDGAFSVGFNVGRDRLEVLLMDFTGNVRRRAHIAYEFPNPQLVINEITKHLAQFHRSRIVGVGIAAPFDLGGWRDLLGMPSPLADAWRGFDLQAQVQILAPAPVSLLKDTSAACLAELVAGEGRNHQNFLYVYVSTFVGGGLVLNGRLHGGERGNAGALASLSLSAADLARKSAAPKQLIEEASVLTLERRYAENGLDTGARFDARALEAPWREHTERWMLRAANAIVLAALNATSLLDISHVIVDGILERSVLDALVQRVRVARAAYSWEGTQQPTIALGSIGPDAPAMGGALMPLYKHFAPEQVVSLKSA